VSWRNGQEFWVEVAELGGVVASTIGGLRVDEMAPGGRAGVEGTESWVGCGILVSCGGDIFALDESGKSLDGCGTEDPADPARRGIKSKADVARSAAGAAACGGEGEAAL
jgi:hypothetical protein